MGQVFVCVCLFKGAQSEDFWSSERKLHSPMLSTYEVAYNVALWGAGCSCQVPRCKARGSHSVVRRLHDGSATVAGVKQRRESRVAGVRKHYINW